MCCYRQIFRTSFSIRVMDNFTFKNQRVTPATVRWAKLATYLAIVLFLFHQTNTYHLPVESFSNNIDPQNFVDRTGYVLSDPKYAVTDQIYPLTPISSLRCCSSSVIAVSGLNSRPLSRMEPPSSHLLVFRSRLSPLLASLSAGMPA